MRILHMNSYLLMLSIMIIIFHFVLEAPVTYFTVKLIVLWKVSLIRFLLLRLENRVQIHNQV